jgi:geranylgeranyl pyrophosphate synthase
MDAVTSDVSVLQEASQHILRAGGKRIRPRMMLLAYQALGGTNLADVTPVAAAVELVHTASVVHDDINDHGLVRRGRPSVNALWGRTFALLTGDFLFTKVYELMAPHKDLNELLADAVVALVEGETLQAAAVKDNDFTREVYYQIIARKTAALFQSAAQMAGRLAQAGDAVENALKIFGFNVGLAFQIIDDVLDLTADEAQLGKTSGIDLAQGRGYVAAYGHEGGNGNGNGHGAATAVLEAPPPAVDPLTSIKEKVLQGDAIAEAYEKARELVDMAVACLAVIPPSAARDELVQLANLVVERAY